MTTEQKLRNAAERALGAPVRFNAFYKVIETFRGQVVWEGDVSEFGSDQGRVYAWAVESDNGPQYVTVLEKPPVKDAITAVRAWLVTEARKK